MEIIEYKNKYQQETADFIAKIKVGELGWRRSFSNDFSKDFQKDNGNFWLDIENDAIIGTIALKDMGNNIGVLKRMYLDINYRGTGIAQKMLDTLIEFAKAKKFTTIYLSTMPNAKRAIAFYKKNGFKETENYPPECNDDDDSVFMKFKLY